MSSDIDSRTEHTSRSPRNIPGSPAVWGLGTMLAVFLAALGAYANLFPFDTAQAKSIGLVLTLLLAASAARAIYVFKSPGHLDFPFVALAVALLAGVVFAVVNADDRNFASTAAVAQILSPSDGQVSTTGTGHPKQDVRVYTPGRNDGRWYVSVISSTQSETVYMHPIHASGPATATVTVGIGPPGTRGKGTYHIQLLFLSSTQINKFGVPEKDDSAIPSASLTGIKVEDEVVVTR